MLVKACEHLYVVSESWLKGNQSEGVSWPEDVENMHSFSSSGVIRLFYQYLYRWTSFFLPLNLNSLRHHHAGSLFTNEDQKRLACDVFYTFATRFGLVYTISLTLLPHILALFIWHHWHFCHLVHDDAGTDRWAQNGSIPGHSFATFKCQFLPNRMRNQVEN